MSRTGTMTDRQERRNYGQAVQIILSVICILLGALLLFVPQIEVKTLSYAFCIALLVLGLISVVTFFASGGYKRLHDYRFAAGILLLVLGCCGIVRVQELADRFEIYAGLCALVLSAFILQGAVQMKIMKRGSWIAELVLTVLALVGSTFILAGVKLIDRIKGFSAWVLVIAGIFSLISLLIVALGLHNAKRASADIAAEAEQDAV